jgi:hypothetical protein
MITKCELSKQDIEAVAFSRFNRENKKALNISTLIMFAVVILAFAIPIFFNISLVYGTIVIIFGGLLWAIWLSKNRNTYVRKLINQWNEKGEI